MKNLKLVHRISRDVKYTIFTLTESKDIPIEYESYIINDKLLILNPGNLFVNDFYDFIFLFNRMTKEIFGSTNS